MNLLRKFRFVACARILVVGLGLATTTLLGGPAASACGPAPTTLAVAGWTYYSSYDSFEAAKCAVDNLKQRGYQAIWERHNNHYDVFYK
jgi:hypothetical protein